MNILIVDDQSFQRELLGAILSQWPQHTVVSAASGPEALALIKEHDPGIDLVLLDVGMPGMDGLEVLEKIRESPPHRALQVIMCTSYRDRATVTKAIALGAMHYIVKPCTEAVIAGKLRLLAGVPQPSPVIFRPSEQGCFGPGNHSSAGFTCSKA